MPLEITIILLFLVEFCLALGGLALYFYLKSKKHVQQFSPNSTNKIDDKSILVSTIKKYFEEQIEKLHLLANNDIDEQKIAVDARIKLLQSENNLLALKEVDYTNLLILYKQIFDSVDCVSNTNDTQSVDNTEKLQELEVLDENQLTQSDIPTLQDAVALTTKQLSQEKQNGSEEIAKIRKIVIRLHASVTDLKQYIDGSNIADDTSVYCFNKLEEIEIAHAQLNLCSEALERNNSRLRTASKENGSTIDAQQDKLTASIDQDLDTSFAADSEEPFTSSSENFELDESKQSLDLELESDESSDFAESIDFDTEETTQYSSENDEFAAYDELDDMNTEFDADESPEYEFDEDEYAEFEETAEFVLDEDYEVEFDEEENIQLDSSFEIYNADSQQPKISMTEESIALGQQVSAAVPTPETNLVSDDVDEIQPGSDTTDSSHLNSQQQRQEKETREKIELLEVELTSIEKRLDDKTNQLENLQTMETDLSQIDESNSGDDFDKILKEIDNLTELLTTKSQELSKLRVLTNIDNQEKTPDQQTGT